MINSQAENTFITARLSGSAYTFIGLHRDPKDINRWKWIDGSRPSYLNWHKVEPNNYRGREHCASIGKSGYWWDGSCRNPKSYVCETVGKCLMQYVHI